MRLDLSRCRDQDGTGRKIPPPIGGKVDVIKMLCSISKQLRRPETRICRPPPEPAPLAVQMNPCVRSSEAEGQRAQRRCVIFLSCTPYMPFALPHLKRQRAVPWPKVPHYHAGRARIGTVGL